MEAQSLYTLLNSCVVPVAIPAKKVRGTGFFVAPGKILTCAHVVEAAQQQQSPIEITWQGQPLPVQIRQLQSATDLALLEVNLTDHPCVLLYGGADPQNRLYSFGFPDIEPKGASTTFENEGWAGDQLERLKFKQGQARRGMSGSPLLNWETGSVCGIVQLSYGTSTDLGGTGLLTKVILEEFPELQAEQKQYHQQHREWVDSLDAVQRPRVELDWLALPSAGPLEIFISYDQEDEALRKQLTNHLIQMKRTGLIAGYDQKLELGTELKEEAKRRIDRARIILLLVSPDFLASEYHYDVEMQRALERHQANAARVIPIILRDTAGWSDTKFAVLQSLPRNGRPVTQWSNRDEAFAEVAREIRAVVNGLQKQANPQSAH